MSESPLPDWLGSIPARVLESGALAEAVPLDDPGKVLWVQCGALDVFLFRDGDGAAEQRPYARVEAGASAWCMPASGGWRLRGVPLPGSRLLELPRQALLDADGSAVEEQLWGWLRIAYGFGVTEAFPKRVAPLKPGEEPQCEPGTALVPQSRLLWLELVSGTGRLAGTAEVRAPAVLGLADNAWMEAGEQLRATVRTTADLAAAGRLGAALDTTYAQLSRGLAQRLQAADAAEWARLAARSKADRRGIERAALEFRGILEPELLYDQLDTSGDPLLAACRIVGYMQGIDFRPHPASLRGQRQRDPLGNIVTASGVRSRSVTLRAGWWKGDHGPLVARMAEDRRPVALVPARVGGYRLHDPGRRQVLRVDESVAAQIEPLAHAFYRTLAGRVLGAFELLRFATSGLTRDFVLILALGALGGLAGLAGPYLNQPLFDDAIPSADRLQVAQVVMALLGATIAATMFEVTRNLTVLRVEGLTDLSAQAGVWDRLLRLPVPFFRRYTAGDLTLRATAVGAIRAAVAGTTLNSLLSALFSLISLALLFHFSTGLAWLTMALVALLILLMIPGTALKLHFERGVADIAGRLSGLVFQLLGGIAKLRVSAAEPRAFALWARHYGGQERLVLRANLADAWLQVVLDAFPIAASLVLFLAVADQARDAGALTTGAFLGFNAAFGSFLGGMLGVFSAVVGTLQALPLYERLKPILEAETEVAEGRADPGLISGRIELSGVSFRYGDDSPWVLRDVSLQIHPGEFVAIVGGSGAGKSTLLRLLLGFEKPTSGTVFYDGQDLSGLDIGAVRRQMGVVLQHSLLLAGDIYTNVAGAAPLSISDVTEALRACGMEDDIAAMPMGVHTVLPEGGVTLSGGQRQRLLLARAVATRPRVLLLDEATSALDNRSQATVTASLETLKATRIVIAHRLSTIMNADRIYVLEAGRVVQVGTYGELMTREGPFRQLASRQTA